MAEQDDRPEWLKANWDDRVAPMLALSIENQQPDDRARIVQAVAAGEMEFFLDEDRRVVVFQIPELSFCELSYAVIVGHRPGGTTH